MARLTRKNIKVFAGNATNNGVFGSLQAENPVTTTNVEQIQSLPAWSVGWNSATMTSEKLPPLEEFQGIQYVTTYQQAYLMQEGMPEWASTVTYYKGSLAKEVTSNGFRIYCSLTDDNTNHLLSDTSNWKKVMDSSDLYAYDSAVVHLAGAETITGDKTFTNNFIHYKTDIAYTETPSANKYGGFNFLDKNGTEIGAHFAALYSSGSGFSGFNLRNKSGNTATLGLRYNTSGIFYTEAPAPTYTTETSGTQIATTGWVNTVGNNVVHRSGNETITGTKTFSSTISGSINGNAATVTNGVYTTGDQTIGGTKTFKASPAVNISQPKFRLQSSTITKGTKPESDTELGWYNFEDNAGRSMGRLRYYYNKDKSSVIQMTAYQANSSGDSNSASIKVVYPASGGAYATAPASDANGSIVTTVAKNWDSTNKKGYYKLGNGLIIQWFSIGTGTNFSVTFPTPFSSATSYSVASGTMYNSGGETWALNIKNRTSTGFTGLLDGRYNGAMCIAIGY